MLIALSSIDVLNGGRSMGVGVVAAVGVRNMIARYLIVGHRWEINSIIGNDVVYCYVCKG